MCFTLFCSQPAIGQNIEFILGFNREESLQRQTIKFASFPSDPNIYGGRDIKSGGSWLAINIKTGLMAFITNIRLQIPIIRQSRGKLLYQFLRTSFLEQKHQTTQVDEYIKFKLSEVLQKKQYSPCNFTVYNIRSKRMFYICTEWKNGVKELGGKAPHGICNCDISEIWPKTSFGIDKFKLYLQRKDINNLQQKLMELKKIFQNKQKMDATQPNSSIFVQRHLNRLGHYALTKTTTLIVIYKNMGYNEIMIKQISYSDNNTEAATNMILKIQK